MGLDGVELIMETEDRFGIAIDDSEYAELRTVGDLYRIVLSKLGPPDSRRTNSEPTSCPSVLPFLATRRAIMSLSGAKREDVRPSSSLRTLLPLTRRRERWMELGRMTQIELPELRLPGFLRDSCVLATLMVCTSLIGWCFVLGANWVTVGFGASCLICFAVYKLTQPLAVVFPASCITIGDIVRHASPPAYASQWVRRQPSLASAPDAVWADLVALVADQLCVAKDEIQPTSRFIEDLRVG